MLRKKTKSNISAFWAIVIIALLTYTCLAKDRLLDGIFGDFQNPTIYGNTLKHLDRTQVTQDKVVIASTPSKFDPYPDYNSEAWNATNASEFNKCRGPSGLNYTHGDDVYHGVLPAFKEPSVGSFKELGINENICYERKTKLGPYGYNEVEAKTISFKGTDWHEWQELCVADNIDRYRESQPPTGALAATAPKKERTAIVIRISSGRKFSENDKETIRALINELALRSGGEYQVFLLVHLTTETRPVWQDKDVYEAAVGNDVPPEFANMTILWSQTKMKDLYPNLDEHAHSIRASHWLPLQHFSRMFPQFEYLWDWPMDVRHTGHHYEALEKISQFAKKQPRKGLWERNERFYIPSVHGDYSTDFRKYVEKLSGTNTIWGPPAVSNLIPSGPKTPVTDPTQDQYQWGVGEEGDLVTLAPIFNPNDTQWKSKDEIWGYQGTLNTPRRASIGTLARVSRRLLNSMHIDNLGGNSFTTEMSPASVALLHGLKAVYAPVPVMFDTAWPAKNLDQSLNPGRKGESGSHQESPFGRGLETRLQRSTWYPQTAPGRRLYNNWMGWEDTGIGGSKWEGENGRTCLPSIFLYVKDTFPTERGHVSASSSNSFSPSYVSGSL